MILEDWRTGRLGMQARYWGFGGWDGRATFALWRKKLVGSPGRFWFKYVVKPHFFVTFPGLIVFRILLLSYRSIISMSLGC